MENTFKNIPFLRITLAFAIGIYLASILAIQSTFLLILVIGITGFLVLVHTRYTYFLSPIFGILAFILIALFGAITYEQYNDITSTETRGLIAATVMETPQEKANSFKSLVLLHSIKTPDTLIGTREKILVYFEKTPDIKQLKPGSQIIFEQSSKSIENRGNPYEFNYKKYLGKKHIYRQVYLKSENWKLAGYRNNTPLLWAETIRDKLLKIYHNQNIGAKETEIFSALTLGYKRELDQETKRIFSSAGAMHVLAVSGLHVGILFYLFSFCFGFLQKRKTGRFFYVLLAIGFLYTYAFITGLSPSVLRACTMFSLIIIASNINRRTNIYNTLATSAFLLLLINPNNLFETGFQLSYIAVYGIVFLQPRLAGLWPIKNKVGLFFWNLTTVSIAAQIVTFPLSAYYFNQFPTYFLFSNLVVIPAAMLLIPLGLCLLPFSQIPLLAGLISTAVKWIIKGVYFILSSIESFPNSTPDIVLNRPELLLVLAILFSIFLFLNSHQAMFLKTTLSFGILFILLILLYETKQFNQHEIIVLNSKKTVACFIASNKMYIISEDTLSVNDYNYSSVQEIKRHKRLTNTIFLSAEATYRDDFLFLDKGLAIFEGKKVLLKSHHTASITKILPDIIVSNKPINSIEPVLNDCCFIKFWPDRKKSSSDINQHILSAQGAFITTW